MKIWRKKTCFRFLL